MYDFALINLFETFNKSDFQMMDGILILGRNACVCCMSIYILYVYGIQWGYFVKFDLYFSIVSRCTSHTHTDNGFSRTNKSRNNIFLYFGA